MAFNPDMGAWTINSVSVITPGFWPVNLELLWSPAPHIYSNPVDADEITLARRPAVVDAEHDILFQVSGTDTWNGASASTMAACFKLNHDRLRTVCGTPDTWGSESVATVVTDPLDVALTGQIQPRVLPLAQNSGPVANTTVVVRIIGGELTPPETP